MLNAASICWWLSASLPLHTGILQKRWIVASVVELYSDVYQWVCGGKEGETVALVNLIKYLIKYILQFKSLQLKKKYLQTMRQDVESCKKSFENKFSSNRLSRISSLPLELTFYCCNRHIHNYLITMLPSVAHFIRIRLSYGFHVLTKSNP